MITMIEIPEIRPILNFRTLVCEIGGGTWPVDWDVLGTTLATVTGFKDPEPLTT